MMWHQREMMGMRGPVMIDDERVSCFAAALVAHACSAPWLLARSMLFAICALGPGGGRADCLGGEGPRAKLRRHKCPDTPGTAKNTESDVDNGLSDWAEPQRLGPWQANKMKAARGGLCDLFFPQLPDFFAPYRCGKCRWPADSKPSWNAWAAHSSGCSQTHGLIPTRLCRNDYDPPPHAANDDLPSALLREVLVPHQPVGPLSRGHVDHMALRNG